MNKIASLGVAAALFAAVMSDASAATAQGRYFQNAAGICQASLPSYEGAIRKRPTAVANEGSSSAFVSCSAPTSAESSQGITQVYAVLYNRTAAAIPVTCTYVHNYQSGGTIVPKTISVPANSRAFLSWTPADVGATSTMSFANFNCALEPGTDVGYVYYFYNYEIGT